MTERMCAFKPSAAGIGEKLLCTLHRSLYDARDKGATRHRDDVVNLRTMAQFCIKTDVEITNFGICFQICFSWILNIGYWIDLLLLDIGY